MSPLNLTGNWRIVAGVVLGIIVGFSIVRSQIAWRRTLLNLFSIEDCRFIKVLLFSGTIGIILFYLLERWGVVHIQLRPGFFWASVIGGIITGCGLFICGHIPVTAISSMASGRVYSLWVLIGMLIAMPAVSVVSNFLTRTLYMWEAPVKFYTRLDDYASINMILLWVPSILLIATLFIEFTVEEKG